MEEANREKFLKGITDKMDDSMNNLNTNTRLTQNNDKLRSNLINKYVGDDVVINDLGSNSDGASYQRNFWGRKLNIPRHAGSTAHEITHYERDKNGSAVRGNNDLSYFEDANKILKERNYIDNEEGEANRGAFIKIYLDKNSGGRDWKNVHHTGKVSNKSYQQGGLLIDPDKQGIQNLNYHMDPETRKKFEENKKQIGISK